MKLTFYVDESRTEGSKIWNNNEILVSAGGVIINEEIAKNAIEIVKRNGNKEIKGSDLWKKENTTLRKEIFDNVVSKVHGIYHILNESTHFGLDMLYEFIYHDNFDEYHKFEKIRYSFVNYLSEEKPDFLVEIYSSWQKHNKINATEVKNKIIYLISEWEYDYYQKQQLIEHLKNTNHEFNQRFLDFINKDAKWDDSVIREAEENASSKSVILEDNKHITIISSVIVDIFRNFSDAEVILDKSTKQMGQRLILLNGMFGNRIVEKESTNDVGLWIADWYVVFIRKSFENLIYSEHLEKSFFIENKKIIKTCLQNCIDLSNGIPYKSRYKIDRILNPSGPSYERWLEALNNDIEKRTM